MAGRILIIDPVPTNRMVLRAKLALAHYDVALADGIQQAKSLFDSQNFEAVLISSSLATDSHDCALNWMREVRTGNGDATIFVFMHDDSAAEVSLDLQSQCLRAGADDVLSRPFTEEVLLSRIRNLMRDNTYHRELHLPALQNDLPSDTPQIDAPPVKIVSTHICTTDLPHFEARMRTCLFKLNQNLHGSKKVGPVPLSVLTQTEAPPAEPDVVLLIVQDEAADRALSIMSQMRSRTRTHHLRIILVFQSANPVLTARAFDLGAHDVVTIDTPVKEVAARIDIQAQIHRTICTRKHIVREGLRQAITDPLTGLHNRRFATHRLKSMQRDCLSSGESLAILACDVDHFKHVNDQYGHTTGDVVLTALAQTLRENLREGDLICRTGGEEFLIALPRTTRSEASRTANRLRKAVGELKIQVVGKHTAVHVTVSIGLAIQDRKVPISDMLEQADQALYQAKARGRNVVAIATAA